MVVLIGRKTEKGGTKHLFPKRLGSPYEHQMSLFPLQERDLGSIIVIFLG